MIWWLASRPMYERDGGGREREREGGWRDEYPEKGSTRDSGIKLQIAACIIMSTEYVTT